MVAYDQSSAAGVAAAAEALAGTRIDTLICNAGVGGSGKGWGSFGQDGQQFGAIDYEGCRRSRGRDAAVILATRRTFRRDVQLPLVRCCLMRVTIGGST